MLQNVSEGIYDSDVTTRHIFSRVEIIDLIIAFANSAYETHLENQPTAKMNGLSNADAWALSRKGNYS